MRKRVLPALLALLCLPLPARAGELGAASYILYEPVTKTVLCAQNADEPRLIASTTKIMTCLLALEKGSLTDTVTVPAACEGVEGSSLYLKAGETYTLGALLGGLMLESGNDAAVAVAIHLAGSVETFCAWMNQRAAELGCTHTQFTNPNGLDDGEAHHASARDLALITAEALRDERFVGLVSTTGLFCAGKTYVNHNRLLRDCPGVFGVKTGYTKAAGRTLVTACRREGMTLICVTLSDPTDWADHAALYEEAFAAWRLERLDGEETLPVVSGTGETLTLRTPAPTWVLIPKTAALTRKAALPPFVYAPVSAGEEVGSLTWLLDGEPLCTLPLQASEDCPLAPVQNQPWWRKLWKREYKKSSPPGVS